MSPYMGGGFGAGLRPQYQVVLAVLGARALKRPVRLHHHEPQVRARGVGGRLSLRGGSHASILTSRYLMSSYTGNGQLPMARPPLAPKITGVNYPVITHGGALVISGNAFTGSTVLTSAALA